MPVQTRSQTRNKTVVSPKVEVREILTRSKTAPKHKVEIKEKKVEKKVVSEIKKEKKVENVVVDMENDDVMEIMEELYSLYSSDTVKETNEAIKLFEEIRDNLNDLLNDNKVTNKEELVKKCKYALEHGKYYVDGMLVVRIMREYFGNKSEMRTIAKNVDKVLDMLYFIQKNQSHFQQKIFSKETKKYSEKAENISKECKSDTFSCIIHGSLRQLISGEMFKIKIACTHVDTLMTFYAEK